MLLVLCTTSRLIYEIDYLVVVELEISDFVLAGHRVGPEFLHEEHLVGKLRCHSYNSRILPLKYNNSNPQQVCACKNHITYAYAANEFTFYLYAHHL